MKYGDFDTLIPALVSLGQEKMNVETALKLRRITRNLTEARKDYLAQRDALVKEFEPEKESIDPTHPRWKEFKDRFTEVANVELPAEVVTEKIKVEDLWRRGPDGERVQLDLSLAELEGLEPIIESGEKPKLEVTKAS